MSPEQFIRQAQEDVDKNISKGSAYPSDPSPEFYCGLNAEGKMLCGMEERPSEWLVVWCENGKIDSRREPFDPSRPNPNLGNPIHQ